MPSWTDFTFEDFRGWHGWVCLFEVVEGHSFDLFTRLWGTNIVTLLGFEMTGQCLRKSGQNQSKHFKGYEEADMAFWQKIQRDHLIGVTDGRLPEEYGRYVRYKDIFLPLSTNGNTVDMLLSATHPKEYGSA